MVIVGMVQYMHEGPEINTKMDTTTLGVHLNVGYTCLEPRCTMNPSAV